MTEIDTLSNHIKNHLQWGPPAGAERVRFLSLALCGEVGELANNVKKDWRGDQGNRSSDIRDELADIANYTFMLAEELKVDLPTQMMKKLLEVEARPEWQRRREGMSIAITDAAGKPVKAGDLIEGQEYEVSPEGVIKDR